MQDLLTLLILLETDMTCCLKWITECVGCLVRLDFSCIILLDTVFILVKKRYPVYSYNLKFYYNIMKPVLIKKCVVVHPKV